MHKLATMMAVLILVTAPAFAGALTGGLAATSSDVGNGLAFAQQGHDGGNGLMPLFGEGVGNAPAFIGNEGGNGFIGNEGGGFIGNEGGGFIGNEGGSSPPLLSRDADG